MHGRFTLNDLTESNHCRSPLKGTALDDVIKKLPLEFGKAYEPPAPFVL